MARLRDRFFVEGVHAAGERVAFAPDDARKLATVLRAQDGDTVEVVDSGGNAWATVLAVADGAVRGTLTAALPRPSRELGIAVTIAQAIPKGQKMELVVEKATELGAAAIVPFRSRRVVGDRTGDHKRERWQRIARGAAQQSGRSVVPAIAPVATWDELLATFADYERVYLPWELAEPRPLRESLDVAAVRSALFVIGPEGGFAADEVAGAREAGAIAISLGARILRTETAALAILAAVAYARGEL
jgi:16S rRNA (uracil1498-N3)-methyltransferase